MACCSRLAVLALAGALPACANLPWHYKQAISRQPPPPQVVSACAPSRMVQAERLMGGLTQLTPGGSKSATIAVLGRPAQADSVVLADNTFMEVLTYETVATVCTPLDLEKGRGLPVVFRNNALIGYGSTYYRRVVVPAMQPAHAGPIPVMGQATPGISPEPYVQTDALNEASTRLGRGRPL